MTSIRRRVGGLALLALLALAATSLLSSDLAYDDAEEPDDVAYYSDRRFLRSGRPRPSVPLNKDACRPSAACDGVLITSQGGVGSSKFIGALEHVVSTGQANFCTNDDRDIDGFKHRPSDAYEHNATALVRNGVCFSKALVILGDPVHTVESTYRRFRMNHVNKLRLATGRRYFRGSGLSGLYQQMADAGEDLTGITDYVTSWEQASRDESFPEVRLVTAKTLFDNAVDHARWIGVEGPGLHGFEVLRFDPKKQHKTEITAASDEAKGKVKGVFGTVDEIMRRVENPAPVVEGAEQGGEGGAEGAGGDAEASTS